jgi:hypothetical protein
MTMLAGSSSVNTYTSAITFSDGSVQSTAANAQVNTLQAGVAVFTGGTSSAVTFTTPYIGASAPMVVVTGLDGVYTHGLSFSITVAGSSGAWTGFTLNLSGALLGAFNWIAVGNPN